MRFHVGAAQQSPLIDTEMYTARRSHAHRSAPAPRERPLLCAPHIEGASR